uniref:SEC7 domain-containing protein n=1 Tax=Panagrolaimus sp. PS1159 TaxID=55785 RepID=A0AC35FHM7_9BILA
MKAVVAILKTPSRSQWGGYIPTEDSDPLLRTFADLRDVFNSVSDLTDVSPQEFISPFLDVITASKPNAAAVTRSLRALKRFLVTGVIPDDGIKIVRVSESIAKAVTQTKFFTNEIPRDEGVLLASLGVMSAIFQSPCGRFLTDESVCAILQCCFRIRFDNMNGPILHELAEDTLANIASVMFSRLPTFKQDFRHPYMKKLLKISIGTSKQKRIVHNKPEALSPEKDISEENQPTDIEGESAAAVEAPVEEVIEEKAPEGSVSDDVEIVQHPVTAITTEQQIENDTNEPEVAAAAIEEQQENEEEEEPEIFDPDFNRNTNLSTHIPYGLPSVREFLRFLAGLMDSSDQANPDPFVLLGLRLYTTALEVGAEYIAQCNFLMKLVKDDLSYNLLHLLDSSRLRIFAAANHAWFLMILVMRSALKFQIEKYFVKIGVLIASDSLTVTNEIKEIALESLVQLFCIPNLITQLFLCYDLSYYSSDVFKDLVRILHENVFSTSGMLEPRHILALDALGAIVDHFLKSSQFTRTPESINQIPYGLENYLDCSPSERLIRKEHIRNASKAFNQKPKKGIEYLIEHKMFAHEPPTPEDVAQFLLITPYLDKKKIGLYLCERDNPEILPAFVKLFKFENQRLDVALRCFLDSFRLPGEAAEISKILQAFADYWYEANGRPYANSDAAFTLAYAIIMLNMDQHNPQVRRNQQPMDSNAFKRNLSGTNGGENFTNELLDEIYVAIKENEIIIPTEHSGPIRETYEWQILLRKGEEEEHKFVDQSIQLDNYELFQISWGNVSSALCFVVDKSENPSIIAKAMNYYRKCVNLSVRYGMCEVCDNLIIQLHKFASFIPGIEALHEKDDEAASQHILSYKNIEYAVCNFAENKKARLALSTMLELIHANGDFLRESWKNVLDTVVQLYRAQLLPTSITHVEDFVDPKGYVSIEPYYNQKENEYKNEGGFLSWLRLTNADHPLKLASEKEELKNSSFQFVSQCHPENLIVDSKYFVLSSLNELLNHIMHGCRIIKDSAALKDAKKNGRLPLQFEEMLVFLTELTVSIIMENKDRLSRIWDKIKTHFEFLLTNFGRNPRIPQRAAIGLLRITNRNLFRLKDEISNEVIQSLSLLFKLNPPGLFMFSRDIAFGLHDLLRANAANLHEARHWRVLFALLEAVGAAVYPDEIVDAHVSQNESRQTDSEQITKPRFYHERGYVSDDALSIKQRPLEHGSSTVSVGSVGTDWIHVSNSDINSHQTVMPQNIKVKVFERGTIVLVPNISRHDTQAFLKVTETIVFLVRDAAHVTPENFESCVQCLRSMIEASLDGGKNAVVTMNEKKMEDDDEDQERRQIDDKKPDVRYAQASHQLLDITFTLHVKVHEIYTNWAKSDSKVTASIPYLWENCWRPLLQAMARLCCDSRREIRMQALTTLQRAMLLPEFSNMEPQQWENCYADVLFPLLLKLLDNISPKEPFDVEETRVRAIQLISKVLLNHLNKLTVLPTFGALFVRILDFMRRYWNCERSELLKEAIPESLKNMILVLDNSGIFVASPELYTATLEGLRPFLPELVEEIMQNLPVKHQDAYRQRSTATSPVSNVTPVQSQPSYISPPISPPQSPSNEPIVPSPQHLPALHPPSPPIMSPSSVVEQPTQMETPPSHPHQSPIYPHQSQIHSQQSPIHHQQSPVHPEQTSPYTQQYYHEQMYHQT